MNRPHPRSSNPGRVRHTDQLDSLNASVRSKRNSSQAIRRAIEAEIEANAQKKRRREAPASAGFKRS